MPRDRIKFGLRYNNADRKITLQDLRDILCRPKRDLTLRTATSRDNSDGFHHVVSLQKPKIVKTEIACLDI